MNLSFSFVFKRSQLPTLPQGMGKGGYKAHRLSGAWSFRKVEGWNWNTVFLLGKTTIRNLKHHIFVNGTIYICLLEKLHGTIIFFNGTMLEKTSWFSRLIFFLCGRTHNCLLGICRMDEFEKIWILRWFFLQHIQRHTQQLQFNSSPPTGFYSIENSNSRLDQPKSPKKGIFNFECSTVMWYFSMSWKLKLIYVLANLMFFPYLPKVFFGAWLMIYAFQRWPPKRVSTKIGGRVTRWGDFWVAIRFDFSKLHGEKISRSWKIFPDLFIGCFLVNLLRFGSMVNDDYFTIHLQFQGMVGFFFAKENQNNLNLFLSLHLFWIQLAIYPVRVVATAVVATAVVVATTVVATVVVVVVVVVVVAMAAAVAVATLAEWASKNAPKGNVRERPWSFYRRKRRIKTTPTFFAGRLWSFYLWFRCLS